MKQKNNLLQTGRLILRVGSVIPSFAWLSQDNGRSRDMDHDWSTMSNSELILLPLSGVSLLHFVNLEDCVCTGIIIPSRRPAACRKYGRALITHEVAGDNL